MAVQNCLAIRGKKIVHKFQKYNMDIVIKNIIWKKQKNTYITTLIFCFSGDIWLYAQVF